MNEIDNEYLYEDIKPKDLDMKVKYSYPDNPDYDIVSFLERIDFENEKIDDLQKNKGFITAYSLSISIHPNILKSSSIYLH